MMRMAGWLMMHAASDVPPHASCVMPDRSRRAVWPCLWRLADGPWLMAHGWVLMAGADVGKLPHGRGGLAASMMHGAVGVARDRCVHWRCVLSPVLRRRLLPPALSTHPSLAQILSALTVNIQ